MRHVAVVGAGAAGLMAAAIAGAQGARVSLFEKNEKAGKKIYITGKGRCNVTNACDTADFFDNIVSNPKFMYKSIYAFGSDALMSFLEENGTKLKIERGDRVFPVSDHASDITKALVKAGERAGIKSRYNIEAKGLVTKETDGQTEVCGLELSDGSRVEADAVILACGGASYPGAGGTRAGYEIAKRYGISVTEIRPSLVPFLVKESYVKDMQGLSLKNVELNIMDGSKKIFSEFGEMLFTHFGISGPLVLTASARTGDVLRARKSLSAFIDLKPAIPDKELDMRLLREIESKGKKNISSFFEGMLPGSMQPVFLALTGLDGQRKVHSVTGEERRAIQKLLRAFPLTLTGTRGFSEAIVTKGGVDVREINPSTMESRKIKNLYFCGEMVDVDALTGGFNLQCAFSMGYVAGLNASKGD